MHFIWLSLAVVISQTETEHDKKGKINKWLFYLKQINAKTPPQSVAVIPFCALTFSLTDPTPSLKS